MDARIGLHRKAAAHLRVVPQLVARGHQVTATTSSERNIAALQAPGADPIVMDGLD